MQRAAQRAGQAAPAVAVVGALTAGGGASALAAAPPAAAATPAAATHAGSVGAVPLHRAQLDAAAAPRLRAAARHARRADRGYTVRTGDTLSGIAQRFYGHASDWPYLFHVNDAKISDPNLIYTGQVFQVPANPPASVLNGTYRAQPAAAASSPAPAARQSAASQPAARQSAASQPAGSNTVDADDAPAATSQHSSSGSAARSATHSSGTRARVTSSGSGHVCTGSGGSMLPQNYGASVTFLLAHGYSANAAAGIAGNIWQESGGNPESVGDGGGGLIGWTPLPGGYVTGNPSADLQTQLNAILTFNQIWAQYIPALNAAASPAQAADIYVTDFERAGIPAAANREAAATAVAAACGL